MRKYLATLILVASLSPASSATYTIQNWPRDLNKVPYDAWKYNSDGTWVEVGTIIVGEHPTTGMTFKDTEEAKILDAKCSHKKQACGLFERHPRLDRTYELRSQYDLEQSWSDQLCGRLTQHYSWPEVYEFLSVIGAPHKDAWGRPARMKKAARLVTERPA